ncbi:hypothetical protein B0A48_01256 [Cryoendolithus antarcticus]|uniref:rRNA-processing protein EBP2 n=1 Tax=Cryoendolithus antarcticus TaxID=1507870 RepID=A0A1V8TSP4_9PEZI|nr:hypothetical protein B0A48_01256 [Cryoendolithus antarcticus]
MAKKEKSLKAALERHQGVDHKLERQKKFQKDAEKRKKKQLEVHTSENGNGVTSNGDAAPAVQAPSKGKALRAEKPAADAAEEDEEADGWVSDNDDDEDLEAADERIFGAAVGELSDESESDSGDEADELPNGVPLDDDDEDDEAEEDENDIPLSDIESIASEDKGDVIPHQRLTINNTAALTRALKSFALPSSLPFSELQSVTSATPLEIPDAEDDLNRELAFYAQSLHAVKEARVKLKKEGVAFTRPTDYFAEMVKSEELMGKVKAKLVDEAARKKASGDARRQRDLKKFGKQVQVAKLQERAASKRDTMEKIGLLKRKRQGAELGSAKEDDMFDVALEDAATTAKKDKEDRRASGGRGDREGPRKRAKKDEKFGFGGKKRFAKSNDARSSGDVSGFSAKRMKGKPGGKPAGKARPGKARRAKM